MGKKLVIGIVGVVFLLVGGVFVAPNFINWNNYKNELTAQLKDLTGRDFFIGGNIKITILPAPAVVVEDLRMSNVAGAAAPDMVSLKLAEVRVALGPLLGGEIRVDSIKLVDPVIQIERFKDGENNLVFDTGGSGESRDDVRETGGQRAGDSASVTVGSPAVPAIRLDNFIIENGTLVYRDAAAGTTERVEKINARFAAASLLGPFESTGRAVLRGLPLRYEISVGKVIQSRTVPLNANIGVGSAQASLKVSGAVLGLGGAPRFKGSLKAGGGGLAELIASVTGMRRLPGFLAQDFEFEGDVVASAESVEIKDLSMRLGEARGSATLLAELGGVPNVSAELKFNTIDLDAWLVLPEAKGGPVARKVKTSSVQSVPGGRGKKRVPAGKGGSGGPGFQLPKGVNASVDVSVDSILFKGDRIRQLRASATLAGGELTLSQFTVQLPGGSDLALFGFVSTAQGKPKFEGEAEATVNDLRRVAKWLGVSLPEVSTGRLRKMTLTSKVDATPENIRVSSLDLQADSSRLTGAVTLSLRKRPAFGANLTLDRLNLDAYMNGGPKGRNKGPRKSAPDAAKGNKEKAKSAAGPSLPSLSFLTAFDANVKARVKTLEYGGITIKDVRLEALLFDNALTVKRLSVAKAAGASLNFSGALKGLSGIPKADKLKLRVRSKNISKLLRLAGVSASVDGKKLGPVAFDGTLDGSLLRPGIGMALKVAGGRLDVSGSVSFLPLISGVDLKTRARFKNPMVLVRALGLSYRPVGPLGKLDVSAKVKGDLAKVSVQDLKGAIGSAVFAGNVSLNRKGARPFIAAGLSLGDLKIDPFLPREQRASVSFTRSAKAEGSYGMPGVIAASWRGPKPAGDAGRIQKAALKQGTDDRWSADPIDLSFLKAFDADIKIKAKSISMRKYRAEKADLSVTARDGVVRADQISAILFGGALKGKASVSPGPKGNRIEAALDLGGVDVGRASEALTGKRAATGAAFVNANVTADGRSVADWISSLNGTAAVELRKLDVKKGAAGKQLGGLLSLLKSLNKLGGALGGKKEGLLDMKGTFSIDNGVVSTKDLNVVSNLYTGRAAGNVDLPKWKIDISGSAKLSPNLLTQLLASKAKVPDTIPFRVYGKLDVPNVKVDTGKATAGGGGIPGLGNLQKKLDKKGLGALGGVLGSILGGGRKSQSAPPPSPSSPETSGGLPPPPPPSQQQQVKPKDIFRGLLRGLGR